MTDSHPPVPARYMRGPADDSAVRAGCWFDPIAAERPIKFIQRFCRQSKGRWKGELLTLLEWEKDFLRRLFGWKRADGTRRYRRAYLEVAKKNGKSTLLSALVLYLLLADGEGAPEIYLNAVDREQAGLIFDESARMVADSPELRTRLEVIASRGRIVDPKNFGKIQKNSADVPSKDGINASASVFDEVHRLKSREIYEVFRYAGASRTQPLEVDITTAGEDETGVWFELREYSDKVNAGVIDDHSHLGVVYRALESDDIDDPETWLKANPSLDVTLKRDDFARDLAEAKESPIALANFKRLRLNIICRSEARFIEPDRWRASDDRELTAEQTQSYFVGNGTRRVAYGGLDLSSTIDLTAYVLVLPTDDEDFEVLARAYAPEENAHERARRDRVPYLEYARAGFLTLTPGDVIDYAFISHDVIEDLDRFDLRKLCVDPYNATHLCLDLQAKGAPVEFLRQGFLSLSAPTKELDRLVRAKKLKHLGNPLLTWCVSNAIAEADAAGNQKLSKRKSRERIDLAAGLVNALAAATSESADSAESVYDSRGLEWF